MKTKHLALASLVVGLVSAAPAANSFRVTPYVQRPSANAMSILWLAQESGGATLSYWRADAPAQVTTLTATARTDLSSDVTGLRFSSDDVLEYCEAPELGYTRGPEDADKNKDRCGAWEMPYTTPWQYRARLTGLAPDTAYGYRVELTGGATYANTFRTPPSRDPATWKNLKFIYFSDSETEPADNGASSGLTPDWTIPKTQMVRNYYITQTEAYRQNLLEAQAFGTDLIVMAGDLAQKGSRQCDWDEFWRHNAGLLNDPAGSVPILASPGNHDYWSYNDGGTCGMEKYMSYFEYEPNDAGVDRDQRERFHRVDYGPVTFLFLDGNNGDDSDADRDTNRTMVRGGSGTYHGCRAPDFNEGSLQYQWLERQLKDAQKTSAFTFIVTHQCPFSVGYHGQKYPEDTLSGRPLRVWLPILHKYGVTGWLAGHDEMMEHSVHEGVEERPDGTKAAHAVHVWDMGIAGDGLRGNKFIENEYEIFRADVDSPEETDASGNLIYGGKHYGHMEVTVEKGADGRWRATFDPVYLLYRRTGTASGTYVGKRSYADRWTFVSDRFQTAVPTPAATPVDKAAIAARLASVVPDATPQGLMVSVWSDSASRGFSWQTDAATTQGLVWLLKGAYGAGDDDLFDRAGTFERPGIGLVATNAVSSARDVTAGDLAVLCHRAHVTGLAAGALYSYRVGANGAYAYGRFTVGVGGSVFTAVNLNDAQTKDGTQFWKVANSAATATRLAGGATAVDLLLTGGDLNDVGTFTGVNHATYGKDVPAGYRSWKWSRAVETIAGCLPGVPWMCASGNHDYMHYRAFTAFDYEPKTGLSYAGCRSADFGTTHVVTMPYLKDSIAEYKAAIDWVAADLQAASAAKWKVVCLHWGPYTTGDHGRDSGMEDDSQKGKVANVLKMLTPVFASNHVDLVMQAHDHTFSKTLPYRWNTVGWTDSATDAAVLNLNPKKVEIDGALYDNFPCGTYYVSAGACGHRVDEDTKGYSRDTGDYSYTKRRPAIAIGTTAVASAYKAKGTYASGDFAKPMFGLLKIRGNRLDYEFYVAEESGEATLVDAVRISKAGDTGLLVIMK